MENKPGKIIVHCTASQNGKPWPVSDIRHDHVKYRQWSDIGYHAVIQPDGLTEAGRPENIIGAHTYQHNQDSLGVALIGTDKFTIDQFVSLLMLCRSWQATHKIPMEELYCHHEFTDQKTCPNIPVKTLITWIYTGNREVVEKYLI